MTSSAKRFAHSDAISGVTRQSSPRGAETMMRLTSSSSALYPSGPAGYQLAPAVISAARFARFSRAAITIASRASN
jgi:hypothetical protein